METVSDSRVRHTVAYAHWRKSGIAHAWAKGAPKPYVPASQRALSVHRALPGLWPPPDLLDTCAAPSSAMDVRGSSTKGDGGAGMILLYLGVGGWSSSLSCPTSSISSSCSCS